MVEMENGKIVKSVGIGISEADKFLEKKMKLNVLKEYIRREEKF